MGANTLRDWASCSWGSKGYRHQRACLLSTALICRGSPANQPWSASWAPVPKRPRSGNVPMYFYISRAMIQHQPRRRCSQHHWRDHRVHIGTDTTHFSHSAEGAQRERPSYGPWAGELVVFKLPFSMSQHPASHRKVTELEEHLAHPFMFQMATKEFRGRT